MRASYVLFSIEDEIHQHEIEVSLQHVVVAPLSKRAGTKVPYGKEHAFLRVTLDSWLTGTPCLPGLRHKLDGVVQVVRMICGTKWDCPASDLLRLRDFLFVDLNCKVQPGSSQRYVTCHHIRPSVSPTPYSTLMSRFAEMYFNIRNTCGRPCRIIQCSTTAEELTYYVVQKP